MKNNIKKNVEHLKKMNKQFFLYNDESLTKSKFLEKVDFLEKKYYNALSYYNSQNDLLLKKYNENLYINFMQSYKKFVIKIIYDVLDIFPKLKKVPHMVFLHGSFSKSTNRFFSDIDISILYPNIYKNKLLSIEELISIAIMKILHLKNRDRVHTIMLYLPMKMNRNRLYDTKNCYIIFYNQQMLKYNCRLNFNELMYKIIHSPRSFSSFKHYINKNTSSLLCYEWTYSFEVLYNNYFTKSIHKMIMSNDKKVLLQDKNGTDFKIIVENIIDEIQEENIKTLKNKIKISDLNKKLKVENLHFIYQSLSILRRLLIYSRLEIKNLTLDLFELCDNDYLIKKLGKDNIEKYKSSILQYLWFLSRIEKLCIKFNYNFSSRSVNEINKFDLINQYEELFNSNIEKDIDKYTINLHKNIINCLKNIIRGD